MLEHVIERTVPGAGRMDMASFAGGPASVELVQ